MTSIQKINNDALISQVKGLHHHKDSVKILKTQLKELLSIKNPSAEEQQEIKEIISLIESCKNSISQFDTAQKKLLKSYRIIGTASFWTSVKFYFFRSSLGNTIVTLFDKFKKHPVIAFCF